VDPDRRSDPRGVFGGRGQLADELEVLFRILDLWVEVDRVLELEDRALDRSRFRRGRSNRGRRGR
jgi:hypothetical protein